MSDWYELVFNMFVFNCNYWYSILYAVKLYKKKMRVLKIFINQFCYVIFTIAHDYN